MAKRTAARHAQSFLGALATVLVYLITRRLFGANAALIAGLGTALYRPLLLMPALLLKPNLFLPVLAALVWVLIGARPAGERPRSWLPWFSAGLLAGCGALLRGNMLLLLPAFVLFPVVRSAFERRRGLARGPPRGWIAAAATMLGVACVLLPVAFRNHAVGGVFALTTSGATIHGTSRTPFECSASRSPSGSFSKYAL